MQKLRLDVDALHVESFETSAQAADARGTVEAREMIARTPYCSAIDACPSRLCTDRC